MLLDKFEGLALLSVYEVLLLEVLGVVLRVAAVLVMLVILGGLLLLLQRLSHVAVHELVLQLLQLSLQVAAAIAQEL